MFGKTFTFLLLFLLTTFVVRGADEAFAQSGQPADAAPDASSSAPAGPFLLGEIDGIKPLPLSPNAEDADGSPEGLIAPDADPVLASFQRPGGQILFLDESRRVEGGGIAILTIGDPKPLRALPPSRGSATALETFQAYAPKGAKAPRALVADHRRMAELGYVDPSIRGGLGWDFPDGDEVTELDGLCSDWANAQPYVGWSWFSLFHGILNYEAIIVTDAAAILTGTSEARSTAACLMDGPGAHYTVQRKLGAGPWVTIYSTPAALPAGQGVGYQTYGPEGRTRQYLSTSDGSQQPFRVGASWGDPWGFFTANTN